MSIDVRIAGSADLHSLVALARTSFVANFEDANTPADMSRYIEEAFSPERIREELSDSGATFFWAERGGVAAGYAKLRRGSPLGCVTGPAPVELERLYADPAQIGAGIGRALLQSCIALAAQEGYRTLWLGVWEENQRALAFYHRQGFVAVGEKTFRLGDDLQTDLVMQLEFA